MKYIVIIFLNIITIYAANQSILKDSSRKSPFCDVSDLDELDEFKIKPELSFCTSDQFKSINFALNSDDSSVEKKSYLLTPTQIKSLGIQINDVLKYNKIYTACLLCKKNLLINDQSWGIHFTEEHADLFVPHEKKYRCFYNQECDFESSTTGLNAHLLSHVQAKVFECSLCNFVFASSSYLRKHNCKETEKSSKTRTFSQLEEVPGRLLEEVRSGSLLLNINHQDQEKVFSSQEIKLRGPLTKENGSKMKTKCKFCDLILPLNDTVWIDYIRFHVISMCNQKRGSEVYKCFYDLECTKELRKPSELVNHIISHMGLKLFSCSECSVLFSKAQSLCSHKRIIHKDESLEN